jgi:diguanylate cyclase (GGDEF)-like protein
MGDIDYFKRVNDTLGHAAGDQVLIRIADVLQSAKRGADMVGRLGGEEFAVLLPETSAEQAVEVAERLLGLIAAQPIAWESNSVPVTMSFGCAALTHIAAGASESSLIESLLQAADRALYEAKHAGRNRVAWIEEGEARTGLPSHPAD